MDVVRGEYVCPAASQGELAFARAGHNYMKGTTGTRVHSLKGLRVLPVMAQQGRKVFHYETWVVNVRGHGIMKVPR